MKIAFPELQITLMDSLNKRVLFLQDVITALGLENIKAVHGRAEEMARNKLYREVFNLCVSRAVANITTLSEYCLPFVAEGGKFISYKSSTIEEELEEGKKGIAILGGKIEKVYKFTLPDSDQRRSFVVIDKIKKTPKAYPRKAGTPSKSPLGK
jgi:16S rRNA (guanine527-N7)-methyltransferase